MKVFSAYLVLIVSACTKPAACAIYVQRDAGSGAILYSNVPSPRRPRDRPMATAPPKVASLLQMNFPVIKATEQRHRSNIEAVECGLAALHQFPN